MEELSSNTFVLSFKTDLIYVLIATIFFIYRYMKYKKVYYLFLAVAFPVTLIAAANIPMDYEYSTMLFNGVGIFEILMLIIVFITMIYEYVHNLKKRKSEKNKENEIEVAKNEENQSKII
jgi:tellurite resistance protein TehA-like permease